MQDHALPHQRFQFGHGMQAVDHIVVGIALDNRGRRCSRWRVRFGGIGQRLRDRGPNGPKLPSGTQLVAKHVQQHVEAAVFQFLVP